MNFGVLMFSAVDSFAHPFGEERPLLPGSKGKDSSRGVESRTSLAYNDPRLSKSKYHTLDGSMKTITVEVQADHL